MDKDWKEHFDALHAYDPALGEPPTREAATAYEASLRDPSLRRSHEAEQAFDAAFRAKLNELPVPPGLAERIKEAASVDVTANGADASEYPEDAYRTRAWWMHVALLGSMAAALVVLTITFGFFVNPFAARATPELNEMVAGIEASLQDHGEMFFADHYGELVQHLERNDAPIPAGLPRGIEPKDSFACRRVIVEGQRVTMLCFRREGTTYHLFTFSRDSLPRQMDVPRPILTDFEDTHCATWTDQENVYVLATKGSRRELRSVL